MGWLNDNADLLAVAVNKPILACQRHRFVQKSAGLSKKQQLTGLFYRREARTGCGGYLQMTRFMSRIGHPATPEITHAWRAACARRSAGPTADRSVRS